MRVFSDIPSGFLFFLFLSQYLPLVCFSVWRVPNVGIGIMCRLVNCSMQHDFIFAFCVVHAGSTTHPYHLSIWTDRPYPIRSERVSNHRPFPSTESSQAPRHLIAHLLRITIIKSQSVKIFRPTSQRRATYDLPAIPHI